MLLLAFGVACGGDSEDEPVVVTPAPSPTSRPAASNAPSSQPSPTVGATGAGAPPTQQAVQTAPEGTLNVANLSASLQAIESFRFDLALQMDFDVPEGTQNSEAAAAAALMALFGHIEAEGAYVAPDQYQVDMTFLGMDIKVIQIGEEVWTNDGSGWVSDPDAVVTPFGTSPTEIPFEFIPEAELAGAEITTETLDGVETTRFSFDKDSLAALAEAAGETAGLEDLSEVDTLALDVWITSDGVPVKMTMDVQGESEGVEISVQLEYNIRDINDPSITIQRPS
jgi:hypothetical protein